MKRYKFVLELSNGNEIQATSVGENKDDAVARLLSQPQAIEFIGKEKVTNAVLLGVEDVLPIPADRFVLQPSKDVGWQIVGDPAGMFVVRFKEHDFNNTRKITYMKDTPSNALAEATVLREIAEWLQTYHSEVL